MKTCLVAGGSGFVGSFLCERLLADGNQVYVVDNLVTGRKENISHLTSHRLFQFIEADIRTTDWFNRLTDQKIDWIFNLASPASPIDFDRMPLFIMETSSIGHRNLLDLAEKKKSRIMYASSSEVYGNPEVHPQTETYFGNCNPVGPRSCYDEAKRFGETLSRSYRMEKGVQTRIARIFNTYGPRMRLTDGRILPSFFSQVLAGQKLTLHGDGQQTRSFCFVTDLVDGFVRLIQSDVVDPVNLGNPEEQSVLSVAKAVLEVSGSQNLGYELIPGRPEDPTRRRPDITKAQTLLGWKPSVSFLSGLKTAWASVAPKA